MLEKIVQLDLVRTKTFFFKIKTNGIDLTDGENVDDIERLKIWKARKTMFLKF